MSSAISKWIPLSFLLDGGHSAIFCSEKSISERQHEHSDTAQCLVETLIPMDRVVFRLRQLPQDADRLDVVQLLSKALNIEALTINVLSLARSTDPWVASKIATLQFNETVAIQEVLKQDVNGNITTCGDEWKIRVENLKDSLLLDSHFRGLTPLYDPSVHEADCLAISGLSSHPFGSWQPKGTPKTFMWIRDALPKSLPKIRPILYGYDTTLVNSNSFQSILDLALGLLNQIKANGWGSPTKPLMFLAHSLGGIVLKQALVSLANHIQRDDLLREAIKGAVFFGVPNLGMEQSHLMAMVDGQPNESIVADLSVGSEYLRQLDQQFTGITYLQNVQLYWAYETRKSPTVIRNVRGAWERTGPEEILVTRHSAARGIHQARSRSDLVFSINENHSNMVKFAENDPDYNIVVDKLVQIVAHKQYMPAMRSMLKRPRKIKRILNSTVTASDVLRFLGAPKRDYRLEQIEDKFRNTFDWIFDLHDPGFIQWLQKGVGIFWINGKPGSGKSTMMKFIFKDPRTKDLLSDWKSSTVQIYAAFFFHHRGNSMQKSFDGLLRSVLTQIIEQCGELSLYLLQSFGNELNKSHFPALSQLQRGFFQILKQDKVPFHLCLFLDALDEYDGQLESICQFLSDIAQIPQTATKRIQICFSSRPWEIFMRNFRRCPGFSIQDYTRDDIRNFCLGSIRNENLSATVLEDLVPELVERSKGVFLWVRLVVKDLAQASRVDTDKQELQRRLGALPTELDEYYAEIIERIPYVYRWKTYAMLELAVRSDFLAPRNFVFALSSSESVTYANCVTACQALQSQALPGQTISADRAEKNYFEGLLERYSREYCGGLLEIVRDLELVQVFHQTVEDFVTSPRFKQLVLGDLATITTENGYSFLTKLYLSEQESISQYRGKKPVRFEPHLPLLAKYARAAEATTGRSMRQFWASVPDLNYNSGGVKSLLGLAVRLGLQLLITDILVQDPEALKKSKEPLITYALKSPDSSSVAMIQLLVDGGFRLDRDPDAISLLIIRLYSEDIRLGNNHMDIYVDIARILLENGQSPEIDLRLTAIWDRRQKLFEHKAKCKLLHLSPLPLAKILLAHGANANALDSRGQTPLDVMFGGKFTVGIQLGVRDGFREYVLGKRLPGIDDEDERTSEPLDLAKAQKFYEASHKWACLLVSKGGTCRKTREPRIRAWFERCALFGHPTEALGNALLPAPTASGKWFRSRLAKSSEQ